VSADYARTYDRIDTSSQNSLTIHSPEACFGLIAQKGKRGQEHVSGPVIHCEEQVENRLPEQNAMDFLRGSGWIFYSQILSHEQVRFHTSSSASRQWSKPPVGRPSRIGIMQEDYSTGERYNTSGRNCRSCQASLQRVHISDSLSSMDDLDKGPNRILKLTFLRIYPCGGRDRLHQPKHPAEMALVK